jgi:hypothetical protein
MMGEKKIRRWSINHRYCMGRKSRWEKQILFAS